METNKHIRITEAPDIDSAHPIWPGYTALWNSDRMAKAWATVADEDGNVDADGVMYVLHGIINEYDAALSKAQREVWALEGMLKGLNVS